MTHVTRQSVVPVGIISQKKSSTGKTVSPVTSVTASRAAESVIEVAAKVVLKVCPQPAGDRRIDSNRAVVLRHDLDYLARHRLESLMGTKKRRRVPGKTPTIFAIRPSYLFENDRHNYLRIAVYSAEAILETGLQQRHSVAESDFGRRHMRGNLSDRRRLFVAECLIDRNATQAEIRAWLQRRNG